MKAVLFRIALIATAVLVASCSKHENTETASNEEAPSAPSVTATPAPVKTVAVATPAPPRLAPDGMFFLLVKKSVETTDGIIGLAPGTQVLKQADGKFTADGHPLELQPHEITNDLDIAGRVAGVDARAQAAIRQTLQAHGSPGKPVPGTMPASTPSTPATASNPPPTRPVPATQQVGTGVESSTAIGTAHSKVQNGWLYEKDTAGNWVKVRQVR